MNRTMEPRRLADAATDAGSVAGNRFEMQEPHRSEFVRRVMSGAAARDMHASHGTGSYDAEPTVPASDAFVQRELQRVAMHARSLCEPLFRRAPGSPRILDVGCGTGGTTVAWRCPSSVRAKSWVSMRARRRWRLRGCVPWDTAWIRRG